MTSPPGLVLFTIELSIDRQPTLFLLLSADGAVNRGGSGRQHPVEPDLFIAQLDPQFFADASSLVHDTWILQPGFYAFPGHSGPIHRLQLTFQHANGERRILVYEYRSDSGPPREIQTFVQRAVDVTQPWYDQQREGVAKWKARQPGNSDPVR